MSKKENSTEEKEESLVEEKNVTKEKKVKPTEEKKVAKKKEDKIADEKKAAKKKEDITVKEEKVEADKEKELSDEEKVSTKKEKALKPVDIEKKIKKSISSDKKIIIAIIAVVFVISFGIFGWFYYNNNLKPVVTFDGGSLTTSEFSIYYKTFAPMLEYYGYSADAIPQQIANKAAVDKIILLKAKQAGVTYTAADKEKVDEIFNDASQVKNFTDKGIDPAKMKQLYYNDYTITAYINKLKSELTDDEVTAYLKKTYGDNVDMTEYVTNHILFSTTDSKTGTTMTDDKKAEVKAKAEAVLAKVLAGEDFETLAKQYSEDTGTKEQGGLYKMYLDENTAAEYKTAVQSLAVGATTTSLVETSYGYHIIKLTSKNPKGRVNSDTDREAIASSKIDQIGASMNIKINDSVLKKVVKNITGKDSTAASTTSTGNTSTGSTTNSTSTGTTSTGTTTDNTSTGSTTTK